MTVTVKSSFESVIYSIGYYRMIADEFDVCVKVEYKTADVEYSAVYSDRKSVV